MTVAESYQHCEQVARREARNFYYSFLLLDRPRRHAMCAIYAFMRYCDDLSDGDIVEDRAGGIATWKADLERAFRGEVPQHPLWPAFLDTVAKFGIPHKYFFEMIEGVSSDLEPRRVQTFDELYGYCYKVASVVGLVIIRIFGIENDNFGIAEPLAEKCGIAFQLTNIIRDVREDYENGRVYLPAKDLVQFGVEEQALRGPTLTPALRSLLAFEAGRARQYFLESAPLVAMTPSIGRKSLRALIAVYSQLLDKIVDSGYEVLGPRVRLPLWRKLWILVSNAI